MTGILLSASAQLCKNRFIIRAMKGAIALPFITCPVDTFALRGSDSLVDWWIERSRVPTCVDERETLIMHEYPRVLRCIRVLLDVGVERWTKIEAKLIRPFRILQQIFNSDTQMRNCSLITPSNSVASPRNSMAGKVRILLLGATGYINPTFVPALAHAITNDLQRRFNCYPNCLWAIQTHHPTLTTCGGGEHHSYTAPHQN
jgi:hypothetical protein